jgi:hypothetical protein
MTLTVLDSTSVTSDARRMADERQERPDPEVPERGRRRTFIAQYKLEVLAASDAPGPGEKGAILRREDLYSSRIVDWRRSRDSGALAGLGHSGGRPAADPRDAQIVRRRKRRPSWNRSWLRPASWWMSNQIGRRAGGAQLIAQMAKCAADPAGRQRSPGSGRRSQGRRRSAARSRGEPQLEVGGDQQPGPPDGLLRV